MENKQNGFIDFVLILTKWRKSIIINVLIVGIVSLVISFMLPKWYRATAVVMPPAEGQTAGGLSSILNSLPIATMGLGLGGGSEMTYMAILKSRSLAKDVIDKYNLMEFYEQTTMLETYISFYSDYDVQLTEENMISISYEYKDSVKVAEIVNYVVDKLAERSTNLMLERAQRTKKFVEKRYFQNLRELDSLAIELEKFNKKYGIIEFEEQTKALIQMTAQIESEIFIKRAEIKAIGNAFGKDSPQFKKANDELEILEKQFKDLISNKMETGDSPFSSLFIPFEDLPDLSRKYADIYTNYLLQTKLQEYLLPEFEQAKLQVQKDDPTFQVIDRAVPPDWKSKPKKAFVVIGAVIVAFILQLLLILFVEHVKWLENNDESRYAKFQSIKNAWLFKKNKSN